MVSKALSEQGVDEAVAMACHGDWSGIRALMDAYASSVLLEGEGDIGWVGRCISQAVGSLFRFGRIDIVTEWRALGLPDDLMQSGYGKLVAPEHRVALDAAIAYGGLSDSSVTCLFSAARVRNYGRSLTWWGPSRLLLWLERTSLASNIAHEVLMVIVRDSCTPIQEWLPLLRFINSKPHRSEIERAALQSRDEQEIAVIRLALGGVANSRQTLMLNAMSGDQATELGRLLAGPGNTLVPITPAFAHRLFARGVRSRAFASLRLLTSVRPDDYWISAHSPKGAIPLRTLLEAMDADARAISFSAGIGRAATYQREAEFLRPFVEAGLMAPGQVRVSESLLGGLNLSDIARIEAHGLSDEATSQLLAAHLVQHVIKDERYPNLEFGFLDIAYGLHSTRTGRFSRSALLARLAGHSQYHGSVRAFFAEIDRKTG
jgi:hypothetical protein